MERLIFYLTEDDRRKLEKIALAEGRTMAGSLRRMINEKYETATISIPKIGTISNKGIKIK
jgi:hypothetical protein